jgi:hypothetical protein
MRRLFGPSWRGNCPAVMNEQRVLPVIVMLIINDAFRHEHSQVIAKRKCPEIKQLMVDRAQGEPVLSGIRSLCLPPLNVSGVEPYRLVIQSE